MEIEINGVKYISRPERKSYKPKGKMGMFLAMASMFGMPDLGYSRKRPNIDVVKEFTKIQNKESKLCRQDREWVVHVFNQTFTRRSV